MTQSVTEQGPTPYDPGTLIEDDFVDIKDFSVERKPIRFRCEGDVFEGNRVLGLTVIQDVVKTSQRISSVMEGGDVTPVIDIFKALLTPASAEVFVRRLLSQDDDAIDIQRQAIPVLYYLLEEHGLRPTQPSSPSSTG